MYQLPKWVLANPFPALHDFESLTVIDQTARIYGAMQTLIVEYNAFADSVNTAMGNFTEEEKDAREKFETDMTKVYREFVCSMEKYLKLNLGETATMVIVEGMNNGSIPVPTDNTLSRKEYPAEAAATGAMIISEANKLKNEIALERARINSFTTLKEGSTTGDAEIADARIGYDAKNWGSVGNAIRGQALMRFGSIASGIYSQDTVNDYLPDANGATWNQVYHITDGSIASLIANMPSDISKRKGSLFLVGINQAFPGAPGILSNQAMQFIYDYNGNCLYRRDIHTGSEPYSFYGWYTCDSAIYPQRFLIYNDDHDVLEDANDAYVGTIYSIVATADGAIPANIPEIVRSAGLIRLITTRFELRPNQSTPEMRIQKQQYIFNEALEVIAKREAYSGTGEDVWFDWIILGTGTKTTKRLVTVGAGKDYEKLTDALATAYATGNTEIYVYPGIYDIVEELGGNLSGSGPMIGKNTTLIFDPQAYVVCEYTGGDSNYEAMFSPINAGAGDFTIEGMKIRCKNVRYCVHDERDGDPTHGKHVYRNCNMYADNSGSSWESHQCIGGGFGYSTDIVVENCIFESAGDDGTGIVTWHNNGGGGRSTVIVKDCYFKGATATYNAYGGYGAATDKSTVQICGCSMGKAPMIDENALGTSGVCNMELIAWNNEVRS